MRLNRIIRNITASAALFILSMTVHAQKKQKPLLIDEQGSFAVGGTIKTEAGHFNVNDALNPQGQTFHGDHAYVFYQKPIKAHKYPLVFLHGAGNQKKHGKQQQMVEKAFRTFSSAGNSQCTSSTNPDVGKPEKAWQKQRSSLWQMSSSGLHNFV
nr:hypothetical protein [Sphingobacterium multivorum]